MGRLRSISMYGSHTHFNFQLFKSLIIFFTLSISFIIILPLLSSSFLLFPFISNIFQTLIISNFGYDLQIHMLWVRTFFSIPNFIKRRIQLGIVIPFIKHRYMVIFYYTTFSSFIMCHINIDINVGYTNMSKSKFIVWTKWVWYSSSIRIFFIEDGSCLLQFKK